MPDWTYAALTLLASPILALAKAFSVARRWQFYRVAYTPKIVCQHCGSTIHLLNQWRCSCSFVYAGHLLRTCPACGSLPLFARCQRCGICVMLPQP
jgi:hypothetical protein